jgi:phage terminase large subunit-like protein
MVHVAQSSVAGEKRQTVETAMLMLLYLVGPEAAPNSQLYSAARSRDQAAILFNLASKMCR